MRAAEKSFALPLADARGSVTIWPKQDSGALQRRAVGAVQYRFSRIDRHIFWELALVLPARANLKGDGRCA